MRFHITDDGPKPCDAQIGNCPINKGQADHYENFKEASVAFEKTFETFPKIIRKGLRKVETVAQMEPKKCGSYYGLTIPKEDVEKHLQTWRDHIGSYEAGLMEKAKIDRDQMYAFHVTVLSPKDTRTLKKSGKSIKAEEFKVRMTGIGSVVDGDKEAWFILCESEEIDEYRNSRGLGKHDLHITIGFKNGDIHNQRKDNSTLKIV